MSAKMPMSIILYNRLVSYLHYLKAMLESGSDTVSSSVIANALGANDVQIRKDLAIVSNKGRPKIGYVTKELIADLEHYLGYDKRMDAVLAGVGNLGKALLSYENFQNYGVKIVAAFDIDPALIDTEISGVKILDVSRLVNLCGRLKANIGIIAVPFNEAQGICDKMAAGGVRAIWNFAPTHLRTPEHLIVKNEDMAASLAVLTKQLTENILMDFDL
ncbi:MAG: redox-sensing transcriptional repressor Rex [Clostridiales bacterium]|jgi:redox-sensing transcriptional repressor|nr:redox-sensing transcriptional repressor Rex [Clostridiales bacterium]